MANVWRIHLLKDIPESPNYGEYCLKNNIAAMGWILDDYNADIKAGKIKIESYSDYAKYAKECFDKFDDVRRLAEEVKPGDFIWTRVDGKYYLAKVSADSYYRYNSSDEAVKYRACNELTDIYWKLVGERKSIDERILERMERGRTFSRMFAEDSSELSYWLGYSQGTYDRV